MGQDSGLDATMAESRGIRGTDTLETEADVETSCMDGNLDFEDIC